MFKEEAYRKLSDLIYKGFITVNLDLFGKSIVFKTVNQSEYDLIKIYAGIKDKDYYYRFNIYFLIFSIFLIDGKNILKFRNNKINKLYNFFRDLPEIFINRVSKELTELRKLTEDIVDYLEGFSYTNQSRRKWKLMCNNLPNKEEITGILGTASLGLNVYQENWILINKMLDDEEKYNHDFSLSLLVASAFNPKGARGLGSRHDAFKQKNLERREKLAREGSAKKQAWKPSGWAAPVDTAEELVEELMRQMQGKKDKHDLFIEEHMRKLREKAEKQVWEAEQKLEKIRKKRKEEGIPSITSAQRILSEEESKKLMSKDSNNNLLLISNKSAQKEEQSRFLKKIGSKILTARK